MTDNLITKLIKKINFNLAKQIDVSIANKMCFVPINLQNDVLFVAISATSKKDEILSYINSVLDNKIEFIYLTKDNFDTLFRAFAQSVKERFGIEVGINENDNQTQNSTVEKTPKDEFDIDDSDIDFSIDEDDADLVIDDDSISDNSLKSMGITSSQDDDYDFGYDDNIEPFELISNADIENQEPARKPRGDISKISSPETKKLGEILLEEKLINEKQLEIALSESKAQGIPLGSILVKLGYVSIEDLKAALGAQTGVQLATNEQLNGLTNVLSVLPEEFIKVNKVIPLSMTDKTIVVGMVHPNDKSVINEIIYQTGLRPTVVLITHIEFENFINTYFAEDSSEAHELLREIDTSKIDSAGGELWEQVEQEIKESDGAVSQLANKIITMAIAKRASDIHIEPISVGYRVRFRIDGALTEVLKIPVKVDTALISRFKVLAKMNIAEHRRTQDGSFTLKYKNRAQDFRVNTLPVAGREKMVIRVLQPQMNAREAKSNNIVIPGASDEDIRKLKYLVSAPNGIILSAGPTGSGKTTTLYSLLRYMNTDDVNITTIEDPIEIKLEGINQSAINTKAGITFANSLRAILRQDPDKILIGEIRDYETLEVAISAALTGHLVLSTIHTNSAAATVTRLIEMGAKDYLVSSTLMGVISQRLAKKLCPNCKEEYYPTEEEAKMILTDPAEINQLMHTKIYRAKGCVQCKNTGYQGRLAVTEILIINKAIRKMIAQHAHDVEIEELAVAQGMKTLKMSCLRHILEGNTTIEEQVKMLGLASEG